MLLLIGFLLCNSFVGFTQTEAQDNIKELFNAAVSNKETVGLAGGYSQDGTIGWTHAAGYANKKTQSPFTDTTQVRIASITKPMTAIAVMQLIEAGKIDLNTKVSTYIEAFNTEPLNKITVAHLLQHSAGFGSYKNVREQDNTKNYTSLEQAMQRFVNRDLRFDPGTDFYYTTYGYVVLGVLIEKVSGMSYGDYLKANIFSPAGMTHTYIENNLQLSKNAAAVYHAKKSGKIITKEDHNISDRVPGGGLRSTVLDLLNFGNAVLENKLVSAESLTKMTSNSGLKKEGNPYGLGWYLYGNKDPFGEIFGHNGAQYGCSSFLLLFPDTKRVSVVLSNTSRFENILDLNVQFWVVARDKSQ